MSEIWYFVVILFNLTGWANYSGSQWIISKTYNFVNVGKFKLKYLVKQISKLQLIIIVYYTLVYYYITLFLIPIFRNCNGKHISLFKFKMPTTHTSLSHTTVNFQYSSSYD